MNNQPRVLIVVLLYNSAEYIGDVFSSLKKITYPVDRFEILAIDNASTDSSVELVKKFAPSATLIVNKDNLGFAAGNNVGFKYGEKNNFDYVYLLNADTEVEPDFIDKVASLAQSDKKIAAVQSKLLLYKDKTKLNSIGNEIHYLGFGFARGHNTPDRPLKPKDVNYTSGAASLYDLKKLKEVGYFNPDFFMYHEDLDLGWRLWLVGYKSMLAPDSIVYHKYDFSRSIKKYYFMERNRYMLMLQNYRLASLILIFPAWLAMELGLFAYSFVSGFWKEKLRAYAYFFRIKNYKKILATRKLVQSKRKVKDRGAVKRFVGKIEFQDIDNPALKYIANPIFNLYWQIVRLFIWW